MRRYLKPHDAVNNCDDYHQRNLDNHLQLLTVKMKLTVWSKRNVNQIEDGDFAVIAKRMDLVKEISLRYHHHNYEYVDDDDRDDVKHHHNDDEHVVHHQHLRFLDTFLLG